MEERAVDQLLAKVGGVLSPQATKLSEALMQMLREQIPELVADERLASLLYANAVENLTIALHIYEYGLDLSTFDAPAASVEHARALAQRGISINALLRAYRLAQGVVLDRLLDEIRRTTDDPDLIADGVRRAAQVSFEYIDRISERVVATYQDERDRWLQNQLAARSARVLSLLAHDDVDIDATEKALGYRLRQRHLGVVAWADDTVQPGEGLARLERVLTKVANRAGCPGSPLLVPRDGFTVWAWLPFGQEGAVPGEVLDTAGTEMDDVWMAVGEPAMGVAGFRATHRQARQAQAVALAAAPDVRGRITTFAQVGPIALLCTDIEATRTWVAETLGGLALDDEPHARLRETLRVFLATGGSYAATAEELVMHRNTVQYRLRKAEEVRGRPLQQDRLQVEMALLVCHWLGSTVLRPAP